ncbi:MAG TPA: ribonuclease HII, partial [Candidatus Bathyarchaeia archaeon]|nr:ribonuclease HII [Candidatus Bathyarchaeia archaeon]
MENFRFTQTRQKVNCKKNQFEFSHWELGKLVCGIDEVGRGCLAGPVVTAAVILPRHKIYRGIKDSKIMTPEERQKTFAWIAKNCFYSVGIAHHRIIDQHNIWHATLIAMKKALINLLAIVTQEPSVILVDAMPLNLLDTHYKNIPVNYFPFGEQKSSSIAAASIVAKVTRDALMDLMDPLFPGYHFNNHKGYSTAKHKKALSTLNHTIIHRQEYLKNTRLPDDKDEYDHQQ